MANKKDNKEFMPTIAIPPGDSIRENMEALGMNQEELAARLGITTKHLSNVLNGNAPITYETALLLESVIGASAEFWMNLEMHYQLDQSRLERQKNLSTEIEILNDIQYNKMSEHGWIKHSEDKASQVREVRAFFGVGKLNFIGPSYARTYKKQFPKGDFADYDTLAWIRKAELDGLEKECAEFNRKKLKALLPRFKELTLEKPVSFLPKIYSLCTEAGVAVVLIESQLGADVCGATLCRNNKMILAIAESTIKSDLFWKAFNIEIAHLMGPSRRDFHISYLKDLGSHS